jgi:Tol biopolymer transport system component
MDPEKVHNIEVSPDGSTYAVHEKADDKIKFFSANGQLLRTLLPGEYPYGLDHWLNNEQIALNILQPRFEDQTKYPVDQMIYNSFTSEQKRMLSEQYPDINLVDVSRYWEGFSSTKYDSLVTRVVYPAAIKEDYSEKSGIGYVLLDLENQVKLVEIVTGHFSATPKWAPDGSRFVINDRYGDGEFYTVTRDGVVTQLSHLNSDSAAESNGKQYFSDMYSWSPDGRYLAFWLVSDEISEQNSLFQGTLAIMDTQMGKVTDTCISAGFLGFETPDDLYMPIMWSPDGKYLLTKANEQEERNYQIVLIDLDGRFGAVLGENKIPVGWLDGMDK